MAYDGFVIVHDDLRVLFVFASWAPPFDRNIAVQGCQHGSPSKPLLSCARNRRELAESSEKPMLLAKLFPKAGNHTPGDWLNWTKTRSNKIRSNDENG
jgi:hypothetical protein